MPKKKTNRSAAKRFRKTATGRIKYSKAGRRHLMLGKSGKRRRRLRRGGIVAHADEKRIGVMI